MLTTSAAATGSTWADWARQPRVAAKRTHEGADIPSVAPLAGTTRPVTFVEPEESFFSQSLRGFALSVGTLGLYSFWVRADARRQLHRAIRVGGHPLDYSGTGGEALASFVMGTATTVLLVSVFLYFFTSSGLTGEQARAAMADFRLRRLFISIPLLFLLGSVAYRKRKHMLRRTWWRGQHFDLDGQPWSYALQHFWTAFLVPLTLGWAAPWRASRLEQRKINEMHHGAQRFQSDANVTPLYRAFTALWFGGGTIYVTTMALLGLTIGEPLLAAISTQSLAALMQPSVFRTGLTVVGCGLTPVAGFILYYRAAWLEHQISSLIFDGMRLQLQLPKARFAGLMLWNGLIKIISFGALQPVANAALVRFVVARIKAVPQVG